MNYRKVLALGLCVVMVVLSGCSSNSNTKPSPTGTTVAKTEPTKSPEEEPQPSTDVPEQDFFSKYGVGRLPKKATIPSCAEATDTKNLYKLHIDLDGMQTLAQLSVKNGIIFCADPIMGHDMLYSLEDGKQLCKVDEIGDTVQTGRLLDGSFWSVSFGTLETTLYDIKGHGNTVRKAGDAHCYSFAYVTADGHYELYDNENGEIIVYNLADGKSKVVYRGSDFNKVIHEMDNKCYLELNDGSCLSVNPETGTSELLFDSTKEDTDLTYMGFWPFLYTENQDKITFSPIEDCLQQVEVVKKKKEQSLADLNCGVMALSANGVPSFVSFYDLREQEILAEVKIPGNSELACVQILDSGIALLACVNTNKVEMYAYDLVADRQPEKWPVTIAKRPGVEDEPNAVVKGLNERYGMRIHYGENCKVPDSDKVAEAVTDQKKIDAAVKTLGEFLDTLPDGMTQEMYKGILKGLDIYLCGGISSEGSVLNNTMGYTFVTSNSRIAIAVDITATHDVLYSDIAHEFSHAFEHRIQSVSDKTGMDWLVGWEKLLPSSVKDPYYNSYDTDKHSIDYTPYGTGKPIWFVDQYSRAYPTEDRARIFEYLCEPEDGHIAQQVDYKNLKYKARFYAIMIRSCFDSCKDAENLVWEQYIGKIDKSEFATLINS